MRLKIHYLIRATAVAGWMAASVSPAQEKLPEAAVSKLTAVVNWSPTNQNNTQPADQKDEDRAAALLRDYRGDLVFVSGKSARASGFVAQYKNRKFFITNAHVLAGLGYLSLEPLDRSPLQVQSNTAMAAVGHDLIAIPVTVGGSGIQTLEQVDTDVAVGDPVVVFGNALAGGVVNPILGKVVGLGPRIVEVSAQFEPGSSGGPIIHLRSGKVLGVATYATRREKLSGEEATRRFGYRLDTVTAWQRVDYRKFEYENEVLAAVHELTRQIGNAAEDATQELPESGPHVVQVDGRDVIIPPQPIALRHEYESPLIRSAVVNYLNTVLGKRGNTDGAAAALIDALNTASQNNLAAAAPLLTYDFFQRGDAEAPGWSREEVNGFENEQRARADILRELSEQLKRK